MKNPLKFLILFALTVGLAPFYPEPHILGKLRWIAGGGNGMKAMDIFDLVLHGLPWVLLLGYSGYFLTLKYLKSNHS